MSSKKMRNIPILYDELKTKRTVNLTDTAWGKIKAMALEQGISASEVIERWAKGVGG